MEKGHNSRNRLSQEKIVKIKDYFIVETTSAKLCGISRTTATRWYH